MQSENFDIDSVISLLRASKELFENSRSDEYFSQVEESAKALAIEIDSEEHDFGTVIQDRVRTKKRQFGYESRDDPIIDPRQKYKVEVFYHIMDTAVNSLNLRFSQITEHSLYFSFLYDIFALRDFPAKTRLSSQNRSY